MPGQTSRVPPLRLMRVYLQWRAGQLPGQTCNSGGSSIDITLLLQWRAGQLPGQTSNRGHAHARSVSFNGGPGNCPAKPAPTTKAAKVFDPFNGGPGNCPAKPEMAVTPMLDGLALQWRAGQLPGQTPSPPSIAALQWRAGQLPGQTQARSAQSVLRLATFNGGPGNCPAKPPPTRWALERRVRPSMEGRAIARPNPGLRRTAPVSAIPSMEGRAIARPNTVAGCAQHRGQDPSMEGRAIARPNSTTPAPCSASSPILQWRAGQLPGQTGSNGNASAALAESLQWRAGQLPGQTVWPRGGATLRCAGLQWRAGQLPGQTGRVGRRAHRAESPFNGGPGNCPAKRQSAAWSPLSAPPSMEGRAIARPNLSSASVSSVAGASFNGGPGNCPAKPTRRGYRTTRSAAFNGGPGNCPAKLEALVVEDDVELPSMEGRAIARPNY